MLKEKPERLRKALSKKAKRGMRGYPVGTVAFYGPDDKIATKLVVGIVPAEGAEPDSIRKWHSEEAGQDVRNDAAVVGEALEFLQEEGARTVAMADRIIGCPHEEGIDYPEGEECLCVRSGRGATAGRGKRSTRHEHE
jgi:hypothetical protein